MKIVANDLKLLGRTEFIDEILRRYNNFDELLDACRAALKAVEYCGVNKPVMFKDSVLTEILQAAIAAAN